jgi:histidinol-phosphate/aromatic aminotransferase/cobyric acid decarboxylase-like protein/N-acyl-L-homoserine lactone synthetase
MNQQKLVLSIASNEDRLEIYKIRHLIYAQELHQHAINSNQALSDDLDAENKYIVAKLGHEIMGFISITTPNSKKYSVDKYFTRSDIPFSFDEYLYEIRLLTVLEKNRNSILALALMYAAFRWVQSHGGLHVVAICRAELLEMYRKAGLRPLSLRAKSGKVTYELAVATCKELQEMVENKRSFYDALQHKIEWQLPYLFFTSHACYHGGSFFKALGEDLQTLDKAAHIINADVLDAWFAPSPAVIHAIEHNLTFLLQTSPPTHAEGLIKEIAKARGIKEQHILAGAGSSDLIFLSLLTFLRPTSKVLILDPCYGEYLHVLEKVVQCQITRFDLCREKGFVVDTTALLQEIKKGYDMVVLVNPNSPTGVHIPKKEMEEMLLQVPLTTKVWVDETYIEYVGSSASLEKFAVKTENVLVCKSMSKVYALSGARAAYLCCSPHLIEIVKQFSPPWAISLPAQAAAIAALKDREYYQQQYATTHKLRQLLKQDLQELGIQEIIDGVANFLLFYLPAHFPSKDRFLEYCKRKNLYLRDVSNMGNNIEGNAVRIAVKDEQTQKKMIRIMKEALVELSK